MRIFKGILLLLAFLLIACSNEDKKVIKVGGTVISKVTYDAIKPVFESKGYKSEFILLDANPVCLEACNSEEVDISLGQHKKFIENYNTSKGGDLVMVKPYGYYTGIGLYSLKYKNIEEIPQNARIAIMNDAMNMQIALRILENIGLIKLNENVKNPTIIDIVQNPKNIQIIDLDQAQTVKALDELDAACVFFTHMSNAKKDPKRYLARDNEMINVPMGVIVKAKNENAKWAIDFANSFKDKGVQDKINAAFPGVFEFYKD